MKKLTVKEEIREEIKQIKRELRQLADALLAPDQHPHITALIHGVERQLPFALQAFQTLSDRDVKKFSKRLGKLRAAAHQVTSNRFSSQAHKEFSVAVLQILDRNQATLYPGHVESNVVHLVTAEKPNKPYTNAKFLDAAA